MSCAFKRPWPHRLLARSRAILNGAWLATAAVALLAGGLGNDLTFTIAFTAVTMLLLLAWVWVGSRVQLPGQGRGVWLKVNQNGRVVDAGRIVCGKKQQVLWCQLPKVDGGHWHLTVPTTIALPGPIRIMATVYLDGPFLAQELHDWISRCGYIGVTDWFLCMIRRAVSFSEMRDPYPWPEDQGVLATLLEKGLEGKEIPVPLSNVTRVDVFVECARSGARTPTRTIYLRTS